MKLGLNLLAALWITVVVAFGGRFLVVLVYEEWVEHQYRKTHR